MRASAAGVPSREAGDLVSARSRLRAPVAVSGMAVALAASAAVGALIIGTAGAAASRGSRRRRAEIPDAPAAMVADGRFPLERVSPNRHGRPHRPRPLESVVDRVPVGGMPGDARTRRRLGVGGERSGRPRHADRSRHRSGDAERPAGGSAGVCARWRSDPGSLWVADLVDSSVIELDPGSGTRLRTLRVHLRPTSLAVAGGRLWVAGYKDGTVEEVDLAPGRQSAPFVSETARRRWRSVWARCGSPTASTRRCRGSTRRPTRLRPRSRSAVGRPRSPSPKRGQWRGEPVLASVSHIDPRRNIVVRPLRPSTAAPARSRRLGELDLRRGWGR